MSVNVPGLGGAVCGLLELFSVACSQATLLDVPLTAAVNTIEAPELLTVTVWLPGVAPAAEVKQRPEGQPWAGVGVALKVASLFIVTVTDGKTRPDPPCCGVTVRVAVQVLPGVVGKPVVETPRFTGLLAGY